MGFLIERDKSPLVPPTCPLPLDVIRCILDIYAQDFWEDRASAKEVPSFRVRYSGFKKRIEIMPLLLSSRLLSSLTIPFFYRTIVISKPHQYHSFLTRPHPASYRHIHSMVFTCIIYEMGSGMDGWEREKEMQMLCALRERVRVWWGGQQGSARPMAECAEGSKCKWDLDGALPRGVHFTFRRLGGQGCAAGYLFQAESYTFIGWNGQLPSIPPICKLDHLHSPPSSPTPSPALPVPTSNSYALIPSPPAQPRKWTIPRATLSLGNTPLLQRLISPTAPFLQHLTLSWGMGDWDIDSPYWGSSIGILRKVVKALCKRGTRVVLAVDEGRHVFCGGGREGVWEGLELRDCGAEGECHELKNMKMRVVNEMFRTEDPISEIIDRLKLEAEREEAAVQKVKIIPR